MHPALDVRLLVVRTTGDRVTDRALSDLGGTGVFTREVDRAVLDGETDAAVHSLKDLPTEREPGLAIVAVLERGDPRDAFLAAPGVPDELDQLPLRARVGTSSLRRRALLLERRPDLIVEELRGNLDTRLGRLERRECDAAVLAVAGLERLQRMDSVGQILEPPRWLPAAGQGALAVVARADDADTRARFAPLDHTTTRLEVTAERSVLAGLRGGCQVPVGVLATIQGELMTLHAFVGSADGRHCVRESAQGAAAEAHALAARVLHKLEVAGAGEIVAQLRASQRVAPAPPAP